MRRLNGIQQDKANFFQKVLKVLRPFQVSKIRSYLFIIELLCNAYLFCLLLGFNRIDHISICHFDGYIYVYDNVSQRRNS